MVGTVPLKSIASGSTTGQTEVARLNMVLWSHTGSAYATYALSYDPSREMGIVGDGSGLVALGLSAEDPGGTVMESTGDGSVVGAVINTQDLLDGGLVPDGPMALMAQWIAASPAALFAEVPGGTLLAQLDLKVPFNETPGGPGAQTTSDQIVLYLGLRDTVSGRDLAYGEILFDSRGVASPYFGADTGPGGTGAAIVEMAAGATSRFDTTVAGAASFQGGAYAGSKHFVFAVTAQNLLAAVTAANLEAGGGATALSTNPADYVLTNVSVDAEAEYFSTPDSFSYSVSGLTVEEVPTGGTLTAATGQATSVTTSVGSIFDPFGTPDSITPLAPTGLVLGATSDGGASGTNDLTNVAMPTLTGTAEAGTTITLYDGSTVIGMTTAGSSGTFSITAAAALTQGTNSLTVTATDAAGNVSAASGTLAVTLDTIAPLAPAGLALAAASDSGISSTDGITNVKLPTLTGSAETGSLVRLYDSGTLIGTSVTSDSGTFSVSAITSLNEGANSLFVTATDAAGNTSMASGILAMTLDTTAPTMPTGLALTPSSDSGVRGDGITNVAKPTLTGTAEAGSTITLYDGGSVIGTTTAGGDGSFSVTAASALAQGTNSLAVTVTDAAGNTSALSVTLAVTLVDVRPAAPTGLALALVSNSGMAGDGLTNVALPSVTGTAQAGSTIILYDGASAIGTATAGADGGFSVAVATPLAQGINALSATATDVAGNVSAASGILAVTLNTTAPATTAMAQTCTSGLAGTAEPGGTVLIGNGDAPLVDVTVAADGSWAFLPSTLAAGTYDLTATVENAAGNLSAMTTGPVAAVAADGSFTLSTTDASGLTTISRYSAQDVLQAGNTTTVTPANGRSMITAGATGDDVINSRGTDTIQAGGGTNLVFASGNAATVTGGAGNLVFVAGAGSYVAGGGAGVNTLYGGTGSNTLMGGGAASSILVAGSGNTSLQGGAGSAALMFGGAGRTSFSGSAGGGDTMVGGTGNNSFALTNGAVAFGGPDGADSFSTGTGSSLVVEGNGTEQVLLGGGNATLFGGTGTGTYTVTEGLGGSAVIVGFKATDHIILSGGFTVADAAQAVATATHGAFGTSMRLGDSTTITLFGATLGAGQVGVI